jgi:osmoprotectant transport system ATP-binding protein
MTDAIVLDQVRKAYDGATVLRPASLSIGRGQFVALVGGSGAGKTTLLKTINGLVAPDGGRVRIDGAATGDLDGPTLRRRIGYVFQEVGLFPHLTVAENIGIVPTLLGWDPAAIAARTAELLDLVALPATWRRVGPPPCPAASASGWAWPGPWRPGPRSC